MGGESVTTLSPWPPRDIGFERVNVTPDRSSEIGPLHLSLQDLWLCIAVTQLLNNAGLIKRKRQIRLGLLPGNKKMGVRERGASCHWAVHVFVSQMESGERGGRGGGSFSVVSTCPQKEFPGGD